MLENKLELFLDRYITHTKILKPKFIANNFMKNELNILPKDLTIKNITLELKEKRKNIAIEFLKILKKRKYRKENSIYIV